VTSLVNGQRTHACTYEQCVDVMDVVQIRVRVASVIPTVAVVLYHVGLDASRVQDDLFGWMLGRMLLASDCQCAFFAERRGWH